MSGIESRVRMLERRDAHRSGETGAMLLLRRRLSIRLVPVSLRLGRGLPDGKARFYWIGTLSWSRHRIKTVKRCGRSGRGARAHPSRRHASRGSSG